MLNTQILPGKVEFSYLPLNCQSVLLLPLVDGTRVDSTAPDDDLRSAVLVCGTKKAKSIKFSDINKLKALVEVFRSIS